ncbi:mannitol dehydrogenase family protein [Epibacterium ulvae]|uniref:mannitol dehydrogenase family protein n=1 Tax=Epibacterium ulvae TaxID=1156985 RepID=UPI0024922456|nr:mannitol dehydrogenase family protein [Epibacterium ulvae]
MVVTPILQFGTSRFLQAHADLFVSEARENGQKAGPITVVQSSDDPARRARLEALEKGFPVRIEGISDREPVQETVQVTSVKRALSTAIDWSEVTRVFVDETEIVLSNTGDTGFEPSEADTGRQFDQSMSYPAKLKLLLQSRFAASKCGIQIMPMELIIDNGHVLRDRVLELAQNDSDAFRTYLQRDVVWVNSLVDRIVSQPLRPAGAVAEPYALWAIEDQPGLKLPCSHPSVQVVPSLAQIEALKLFVLNLGHTVLADHWLQSRGCKGTNVREMMAEPETRHHLEQVYQLEVRPAFSAAGIAQEFDDYVQTTLERFENPFLDHRIVDIAQNHNQKIERRIKAMLDFAIEHNDRSPKPVLTGIVGRQTRDAS